MGAGNGATTRREQALHVADELLMDIELHRLSPLDVARKASRLARLLDDGDAQAWLRYETVGYGQTALDAAAASAAIRSGRQTTNKDGATVYGTESLGALELTVRLGQSSVEGLSAPGAGGEWAMGVEAARSNERTRLLADIYQKQRLLDKIVGALHEYVQSCYLELRFGSAAETAFGVVRADVDRRIAALIPDALPMLSAAFENSVSSNPEDWSNAGSTCRRLLKAAADALRPAGRAKQAGGKSIRMDDSAYKNRLADWIQSRSTSKTVVQLVTADLDYLGHRLDAIDKAGHKGAHAAVTRLDASRFITGTYLLLGDILRIDDEAGREGRSSQS